MTASPIPRRLTLRALVLPLVLLLPLAGCGDDGASSSAPSAYAPPDYKFLTPLPLNVGRIDIDDNWAPRGAARRVEHLAPFTPRFALKRMAEDRLVVAGTAGRAVFVIEDASIIRAPRHYEGSLAVRLDIADNDGTLLGKATARIAQVRPITGDSARAERDELYAFVRDMMAEMNVEFEFQVKQAMRDTLQHTSPGAPQPEAVDTQTLSNPEQPPGAAAAAPATAAAPAADDDEGPAVPLSVDPTTSSPAAPPAAPVAAPPRPAPAAPSPAPAAGAPRAPTPLRPPG